MADDTRSPIPRWLFFTAIAVAVLTTSALIWLLFQRTEGPAPTLRTFAERVQEGDCEGSYHLLDGSVQGPLDAEVGRLHRKGPGESVRGLGVVLWCDAVAYLQETLDPQFQVEEMTLRDGIALLKLHDGSLWRLRKAKNSWRIAGQGERGWSGILD